MKELNEAIESGIRDNFLPNGAKAFVVHGSIEMLIDRIAKSVTPMLQKPASDECVHENEEGTICTRCGGTLKNTNPSNTITIDRVIAEEWIKNINVMVQFNGTIEPIDAKLFKEIEKALER